MTIQQIRYAVAISEAGSLNKASEILYVAQPSLTSAIRELERELEVTLFSRSGRGVTLTNDGVEFIHYARQVLQQYDNLLERFGKNGGRKKKFGISTQHYSFAVKSFVELVRQFGTEEYEFAIRETRTRDVIDDVFSGKSEIGILYLSDFNRKPLEKLLRANQLEFHPLTACEAYVYLWKGHPLANRPVIRFPDLAEYPCLSFEQGAGGSFYYAEEILSTAEYPRTIKATDRATMLNLMVGLSGGRRCGQAHGDRLYLPAESASERPGGAVYPGVGPLFEAVPGDPLIRIGPACSPSLLRRAIDPVYNQPFR